MIQVHKYVPWAHEIFSSLFQYLYLLFFSCLTELAVALRTTWNKRRHSILVLFLMLIEILQNILLSSLLLTLFETIILILLISFPISFYKIFFENIRNVCGTLPKVSIGIPQRHCRLGSSDYLSKKKSQIFWSPGACKSYVYTIQ